MRNHRGRKPRYAKGGYLPRVWSYRVAGVPIDAVPIKPIPVDLPKRKKK